MLMSMEQVQGRDRAIRKAELIQGWMTKEQLIWLYERAKRCGTIIEVGSWLGKSTKVLTSVVRDFVVAVDLWDEGYLYRQHLRGPDMSGILVNVVKDKPAGWLFEGFMRNLSVEVSEGKLVPVRAASCDGPRWLTGVVDLGSVDMVFIDADHRYEFVKTDIQTYLPYVRSGGLLCGHDADQSKVRRAVRDSVGEFGIESGIWYKVIQ